MNFRPKPSLIKLVTLSFLFISTNLIAQDSKKSDANSYYFGSGLLSHDLLFDGRHHFFGVDRPIWKFFYLSGQFSYMHAKNDDYFYPKDLFITGHSYNLIAQIDANLRIKIGPLVLIPHAGSMLRYSDEKTQYYSAIYQDNSEYPTSITPDRLREFKGFSRGLAVGLNLEFMIFDHTSLGIRTDIQEYNNAAASLSTIAFQFRSNFSELIKELNVK